MKNPIPFCIALLYSILGTAQNNYPTTPEIPVKDDYAGTVITDNYRWLEDMKNPEVQTWFKSQADYSKSVLDKIPGSDALFNEMMALDNLKKEEYGDVKMSGNTYFYKKTRKGEKVGKLYCRKFPDGAEMLLLDPEKYKAGKTYSISDFTINDNGSKMTIGLAESGAEIGECRILDLSTKKLLPEIIAPVWGASTSWTKDNQSFFYSRLNSADNTSNETLQNIKVLFHKVGTDVKTDKIIASKEILPNLEIKSENWLGIGFSEDYQYMFLNVTSVQPEMLLYYAPIAEFGKTNINWKPLVNREDEITQMAVMGNQLFFLTHKKTPNFKICVTDIRNPDFEHAKVVVPESQKVITYFEASKNFLVYSLSDGINREKYSVDAKTLSINKIPLPEGTNGSSVLNAKENDRIICYNAGWLIPSTIYEYDMATQKLEKSKWFSVDVQYPNLDKYAVKELEVKGRDGTMIPLSIIYPKNMKMDGKTLCYLSGYGSYGVSTTPYFSEMSYALLEQNVIIAYAHVRGGGEKGEAWHKSAFKSTKYNTWRDFIDCADYLVNEKYTSKDKLAGEGMSAGGILIGNAIAERPDLFAAAIVEVGCTNMLRMELTPNGPNQIPEFGALNNPEELKGLLAMDAQSKIVKGGKYPAVLVRTGMNDPRVIPWMPAKFAAILQNNSASKKPVLFAVNFENGHFTEDKKVTYREYANMYSFALWQMGHPNFQPK